MGVAKEVHVSGMIKDIIAQAYQEAYPEPETPKVPETREEKLNHLIQILKDVPEEDFEMAEWVKSERYYYLPLKKRKKKMQCKFAGCALGWAASDPTFIGMGLRFGKKDGNWNDILYKPKKGEKYTGYEAGEEMFELSRGESRFLFDHTEYPKRVNIEDRDCSSKRDISHLYWDVDNYSNITPAMVIERVKFIRDNPDVIDFRMADVFFY